MSRKKYTDDEIKVRRNEAVARYREKNREKENERNKKYRQSPEFKEKHRLRMAEWRKTNPNEAKEISKRTREKHKERINKENRDRYQNDPIYKAKVKEIEARYKASGRRAEVHKKRYNEKTDELKRKSKEWKLNNREKVKEYRRKFLDEYWLSHEQEQRDKLEDCYVVAVIKKQSNYTLKTEDLTEDLIEVFFRF